MSKRRLILLLTALAVAALAAVFAWVGWNQAGQIATVLGGLAAVAAVGVAIWAALPVAQSRPPASARGSPSTSVTPSQARYCRTRELSRRSSRKEFTSHVLRHTFGTTLIRSGHDLVLVAELMGHQRLETTRGCTRPSPADRERAISSLPTDR